MQNLANVVLRIKPREEFRSKTKKMKGYFRVSHTLFEDQAIQKLSGECFRVFLWMSSKAWRFQGSQGMLRASVSKISSETGVGKSTISRALSDLKKEKLIRLAKVDSKWGNLWWVESVFRTDQFEGAQIEEPQKRGEAPPFRDLCSLKMGEEVPRNEEHLKNLRKEKEKNSFKEEEDDEIDLRKARKEFESAFPNEREGEAKIQEWVEREFPGEFKPPRVVMESIVMREWYKNFES